MAPLPAVRVTGYEPPFSSTGVDLFGPIEVTFGRRTVKRWGCLFTCMATRACHIEIAPSLEADDFINVLRRFIARRGGVRLIYSDNGTNFVGAQRELYQALLRSKGQLEKFAQAREIAWRFQPPLASHMSGVWERVIKSARRALNAALGSRSVDDFRMLTFAAEAEYSINSRPLTASSDDPNDLEALTPNHFLNLRHESDNGIPGTSSLTSRKRWQQVQAMADVFWSRWTKEYLPTLQLRKKWQREKRDVKEGDLVMLLENLLPRNRWPLARVLQVFPGSDGFVRTVEVKTARGKYTRPVAKLCLLEEAA